jgi:hyperosmotically inducible protein
MRKISQPKNLMAIPVFVAAIAVSPFAYAQYGTSPREEPQQSNARQYVDDAAITAKVKTAILTDSQLNATKVSVETNQGTVQLSGTVITKDQEAEAVKVANQIDGVRSVQDLLNVRGPQEQ